MPLVFSAAATPLSWTLVTFTGAELGSLTLCLDCAISATFSVVSPSNNGPSVAAITHIAPKLQNFSILFILECNPSMPTHFSCFLHVFMLLFIHLYQSRVFIVTWYVHLSRHVDGSNEQEVTPSSAARSSRHSTISRVSTMGFKSVFKSITRFDFLAAV